MNAIREMADVKAELAALEPPAGTASEQLRLGEEISMAALVARLRKLSLLAFSPMCDNCLRRPAIYCLRVGERPPRFADGECPHCGFRRPSVIVINGGILCDFI